MKTGRLLITCASLALASQTRAQDAAPGGMDMSAMMGMDVNSVSHMAMPGMYGNYTMTREASGTSWQPDATPMEGMHDMGDGMENPWTTMWHGDVNFIYDHQGGPRGGDQAFSSSMGMFMGQRALGGGTFGVRVMMSLDALMGKGGYPLLFQTGESADGVHPLLDRQHPHDLFMELAAAYSHPLTEQAGVFVYAGLPGEPALGPPAYMHRGSGADNPETPLSHHWLDSTHISYGVLTTGLTWKAFKIEGSAFNGREPDQYRWNVETGALNSSALRLSWNPAAAWSLQLSRGWLKSPEQLEPEVNVVRTTASAAYARNVGEEGDWQTLLAWGRNQHNGGHEHGGKADSSDAWLLESALHLGGRYTLFARAEQVEEGELFPLGEPLYGPMYTVRKLTVGGIYDFATLTHVKLGVGGLVSGYDYPDALNSAYGSHPVSYLLFLRAKLD